MKAYSFSILVFFLLQISAHSQTIIKNDTCSNYETINLNAYIDGVRERKDYRKPIFTIDPVFLEDGFKLELVDTSYKILKFRVILETGSSRMELISKNGKIDPISSSSLFLQRGKDSRFLTVEEIIIIRNNICYRIPPLYYNIW